MTGQLFRARFASCVAAAVVAIIAGPLGGQTLTPAEEAAQKKVVEQEKAKSRLAIYGWIESGFTGNPAGPSDHQNFGRVFDDRSNEFLMNQAVLTAERALDPKAGFDWGFKLQLLFGTDARFIHSLGLLDHAMRSGLYQPDISEAYLNLHLPVFTEGGIDVKLGKFVTLEGAETIDREPTPFTPTPTFSILPSPLTTPGRYLLFTPRNGSTWWAA
jgi:hypothetical protein